MKNFLKSALAVAALAFVGVASAVPVSGQGTWETSLQARDIDSDGTVDAYYDTALNITWLANANGNQDATQDQLIGRMDWAGATEWAANLDVGGVTGWRLPQVLDTSVYGFRPDPASSELAHMYYVTLGNEGAANDHGDPMLSNTGYFNNLYANPYWFANADGEDFAWGFSFYFGYQGGYPDSYGNRVWAVRDGDVAASTVTAPVPEPETYALMLAGLGAIGVMRRRRKA